jgi:hypothetical protein
MSELKSQIDVDALEAGDRIEWATELGEFAADVVQIEQEERAASLSKPARLVTNITLDVVKGDREKVDPKLMEYPNREHAVVAFEEEL